jgi:preprotein translocase subunit SecD
MSGGGTDILDILNNSNPQPSSTWEILLQFDKTGGDTFAKLTKKLAGTGRAVGIFLDNDLISTPVIGADLAATGITGGRAVISGNFTAAMAKEIVVLLQSGTLPVPVKIVEIQTLRPK